jgi:N4-gp56 family major capsid protein
MADVFTNAAYVGGTGGSIIPPYYADFMRENLWPNLYFRQLGTQTTIPRHTGDKVKIPKWDSPLSFSNYQQGKSGISAICGDLAEVGTGGSYPVALRALSANFISGEVRQFMGGRGYNDKLVIVSKANYYEGALESLAREMAFEIDRYTRTKISANGFTKHAGTGVAAQTSDGLFGKNIAKIAPWFDTYNVPRWDDSTFVMVAHPLAQYDILTDISATGFVSVARYNDARRIYRGEVGQMYGIRVLLSSAVPITIGATGSASASTGLSGSATGSTAFVFAPDYFYSLELQGGGMEVIHHPLGSAGTADWANLKGSIGVKLFYGVAVSPSAEYRMMRFGHGIGIL